MNRTFILAAIATVTCVSFCIPVSAQSGEYDFHGPVGELQYDPATGVGEGSYPISIAENPANAGFPHLTDGLTLAMTHDPGLITFTGIDLELMIDYIGSPPLYYEPLFFSNGFSVIAFWDLGTGFADVQFPTEVPFFEVEYATVPAAFAGTTDVIETPVEFSDTLDLPNSMLVATLPVTNIGLFDGELEIRPIGLPFRRGDANGDGVVNGLSDGVFMLNFQFVPGSPAPLCADAADADDSGTLNGLADGLALLNYTFLPGTPPPPVPGPDFCGADPTPDGLGCDSNFACN